MRCGGFTQDLCRWIRDARMGAAEGLARVPVTPPRLQSLCQRTEAIERTQEVGAGRQRAQSQGR